MCTRVQALGPAAQSTRVRLRLTRTDSPRARPAPPGGDPRAPTDGLVVRGWSSDRVPGGSGWAWGGPAGREGTRCRHSTAWTPARGGSEQRTEPRSRGRSPCPGHSAGHVPSAEGPTSPSTHRASESHVPSLQSSCHTRNSRLRRGEPASGLHPSPRGPADPRPGPGGSRASAPSWSSDGVQTGRRLCRCWGRRHRTRQEGGAQRAWRAEVGVGGPRSSPQTGTELLGKPPRTQLVPTAGGQRRQGSREAGAVRLRLEVSFWACAMCRGAESPPLPGQDQHRTRHSRGRRSQSNECLDNSCVSKHKNQRGNKTLLSSKRMST